MRHFLRSNKLHLDIASTVNPARSPVQELERMTQQQLR
jgi:hypothetical protein